MLFQVTAPGRCWNWELQDWRTGVKVSPISYFTPSLAKPPWKPALLCLPPHCHQLCPSKCQALCSMFSHKGFHRRLTPAPQSQSTLPPLLLMGNPVLEKLHSDLLKVGGLGWRTAEQRQKWGNGPGFHTAQAMDVQLVNIFMGEIIHPYLFQLLLVFCFLQLNILLILSKNGSYWTFQVTSGAVYPKAHKASRPPWHHQLWALEGLVFVTQRKRPNVLEIKIRFYEKQKLWQHWLQICRCGSFFSKPIWEGCTVCVNDFEVN